MKVEVCFMLFNEFCAGFGTTLPNSFGNPSSSISGAMYEGLGRTVKPNILLRRFQCIDQSINLKKRKVKCELTIYNKICEGSGRPLKL